MLRKLLPSCRLQPSLLPGVTAGLLLTASSGVWAHAAAGGDGWLHPLTGSDHMVAMVAVGAWSTQLGGRALWAVPGAFLLFMLIGGLVGFELVDVPYVETGVALSVLLLGAAIMLHGRVPLWGATTAVALFGLCHGYLHGYEMPIAEHRVLNTLGFLGTTAALHVLGLLLGWTTERLPKGQALLRLSGAASTLFGLWLVAAS